jgi:hypothetical protein
LATSPFDTFIKTLLICMTSSKFVSLVKLPWIQKVNTACDGNYTPVLHSWTLFL